MKVLLFTDADKDDLYSLVILVAQAYRKNIKMLGIVCEDGFLSYPENVSITNFWLTDILNYDKIKIYRGIDRDPYLKQQRNFPPLFVSSYLEVMKNNFGYQRSNFAGENLDELVEKLRDEDDKSISILTTGNVTTLAHLLKKHKFFKSKVKEVFTMGGNFKVPGNVPPEDPLRPRVVPNAEFNFYLDPTSVSTVLTYLGEKLHICPLDATNFAPLDRQTILAIRAAAEEHIATIKDPFIKNLHEQFLKLLESTLLTVNTKLFLWDLVATLLFLGADLNEKSIKENVEIIWTGQIVRTLPTDRNKCIIFTFIDFKALIKRIVEHLVRR